MTRTPVRSAFLISLVLLALTASAWAELEVANVFGRHMVLQREVELPVWGRSDPGAQITVTLAEATAQATTDPEGRWRVTLPAMPAGGPHILTVRGAGDDVVSFDDVLVGEVWLCSGQSNMAWPVRSAVNGKAEVKSANHPRIRQFAVPHTASATPRGDVPGSWSVCSPNTAAEYTACGYFMARKLQAELNVPIGLINSSWGGTRIEPWTSPGGFALEPALAGIAEQIARRSPEHPAHQAAMREYIDTTEAWVAAARLALQAGETVPERPAMPSTLVPPKDRQEPAMLYHGMIHGLVGFPLRGAIWYQGEANIGDGKLYTDKMRALIAGWRQLWGIGEFPFYFVQLAPYRYRGQSSRSLPELWQAQDAVARTVPNTGMVVINDIGTVNDIHPTNKQEVGRRLANLALSRTYGKSGIVDSGPAFASLEVKGDSLHVKFDHTAGALRWRDGVPGKDFEIMGKGTSWQQAEARIEGDTVILSHPRVKSPAIVRFAWNQAAEPTLVNDAALPAGAFSAGELPRPNALPGLAESKEYTLVLDLDLLELGPAITYDADHRDTIDGGFDRIAYLMELETAAGTATHVWVSMKAFTDDLAQIGVPTAASDASFAIRVEELTILSNAMGIAPGKGLEGGSIEFWPDSYGTPNAAKVPGASDDLFDWGDQRNHPRDGYGSMQVHHHAAGVTLFAINHWSQGERADLGIGNSKGRSRDWTFAANAGSYRAGRLRVFVREK